MIDLNLNEVRQALEAERGSLLRSLQAEPVEHAGDDFSDELDLANHTAEADVRGTLDQFNADMLERIERALQRLDDGVYGQCLGCGQAIAAERLQALPYAELCVGCQSKQEERRKHP